ncbi:MAG: glycoside hydrolase family 25 [Agathobacter sp.]|nr:glycoside hydrolase family 25 [Agathobacter sp.]
MLNRILDWWDELDQKKRKLIIGVAIGIFVILIGIAIGIVNRNDPSNDFNTIYLESGGTEDTEEKDKPSIEQEDPQSVAGGGMTSQEGANVDISQVVDKLPSNETQELTLGIDVARYQGTIDWKKVAESGVDFAIVRVGYRTLKTGEIVADANAKYNMQEASKYGIKLGAYFFSTAITKEEAIEEANWVADYIAKYQITYPVVYNCEGYEDSENRQYVLTKQERSDIAIAFLDRIKERGYSPMFYASKNEMEDDAKWETSRLESRYKIWVAQYPDTPYPQTEKTSYTGKHEMWQYTNNGTVPGISKPVDMNVAYFGFKNTEGPQDSEAPEDVEADVEANMKFREVNETVTAKERTNLRNKPSQGSDSTVIYTLTNGETATRTGISDSGWSRVEFNGQTLYAVSSYLTTDLSIKQPESEEQTYEEANGIKTKFTEVDDYVSVISSVDHVNLRAKPTTQDSVSPVVVELQKGEVVHRIGVSVDAEHTYSKVEYNGQILYCVSKYLVVVEENTAESE